MNILNRTKTDLELQLMLAKELPELIKVIKSPEGGHAVIWVKEKESVTPREWDWVVNEVIKRKYSKHTCHSFLDTLGILASEDTADVDGQYEYQSDGSYYEQWLVWKTTWQQRTVAYFKTIGNL